MIRRLAPLALAIAALAGLNGCAYLDKFTDTGERPVPVAGPGTLSLIPVPFAELPGWRGDHHAEALPALLKSCSKFATLPLDRPVTPGAFAGVTATWKPICDAAARLPRGNDASVRYFFENWFQPHQAVGAEGLTGLFTGYYEAELTASRTPSNRYRVPVYAAPADLEAAKERAGGRYLTRAEISGGALKGKGLEILWADDPVDVFFLHIQGSGRAVMDDGRVIRLGYAGDNGHPYASIGRELVARGAMRMEDLSMQSLRAWIAANPVQGANLMSQNPRYIFFRIVHGQDGPIGAQGVALTAGRSLAVDKEIIPYGVPLWLDVPDPLNTAVPIRRVMVAQDTGSAIKGAVRGDIFFGFGDEAAQRAGTMKATGRYYLLLPRSLTAPTS